MFEIKENKSEKSEKVDKSEKFIEHKNTIIDDSKVVAAIECTHGEFSSYLRLSCFDRESIFGDEAFENRKKIQVVSASEKQEIGTMNITGVDGVINNYPVVIDICYFFYQSSDKTSYRNADKFIVTYRDCSPKVDHDLIKKYIKNRFSSSKHFVDLSNSYSIMDSLF
jgi:hypothetical protein